MGTREDGSFGNLLKDMRLASGLTQDELAERAGMSVRGLRYLELGSRRPYPDTIRRLADALDPSPADRAALVTAGRRPVRTGTAARRWPADARPPAAVNPLIGREAELAELRRLVWRDDVRVVTIIGPGGVGKTRLAMEMAAKLGDRFPDSVWVPLSSVRDADRLPAAIKQALGLLPSGALSDEDAISDALDGRATVLILDNLEHLLQAVGVLVMLLSRCPGLTIVATSRAALQIAGEHEFPLAPLPIPPADEALPVHALAANPAVDLFVRRAQAVRPQFVLDGSNAVDVAAICRELDCLPLAIELAAARIRALSPADMLRRLQQRRLPFLTGGRAGGPPRHGTMRAAIDWSYALLDVPSRAVFRRLAVFHGGCTLTTAEAVLGGREPAPPDFLEVVEELQRNSLITVTNLDGPTPRLHMLETIREYGLDRLHACGENTAVESAHAQHFLSIAEEAARRIYTQHAAGSIARLVSDRDNLRAAVRWSMENGDPATALRFTAALWSFWYVRGEVTEGRAVVAAVLDLAGRGPDCVPLARTLLGAGQLALAQGDYPSGAALLGESIAMHRALDDTRGTAEAVLAAGFAARLRDRPEEAAALLNEALTLGETSAHDFVIAAALHHLGMLAAVQGHHDRARRLLEDSLTRYRRLTLHRFVALVTLSLGEVALAAGDTASARELFDASLAGMVDARAMLDIPSALEAYADLAAAHENLAHAVRLAGSAAGHRRTMGSQTWPDAQHRRTRWLARARSRLSGPAYQAAWADGQRMNIGDAVAACCRPAP